MPFFYFSVDTDGFILYNRKENISHSDKIVEKKMKRLLSVLISVLLLFSLSFTFGCQKEDKTFLVEFVLQCEVGNETVSVTVNGQNSVVSKRIKSGSKLKDVIGFDGWNVATTDSDYEFVGWQIVVDGSGTNINENTVAKSSFAKDGKITIRPRCINAEGEKFKIVFQLNYTYTEYIMYELRDKNTKQKIGSETEEIIRESYVKVDGQTSLPDMVNLSAGENLYNIINELSEPVEVDKNGQLYDEFKFEAWYILLDGALYDIEDTTLISSDIANDDGEITIVAKCMQGWVGVLVKYV